MATPGSAPAVRPLREFGEFLSSRRARLQPADVGLSDGARRRTPGLRREEVAQLSGVSPTYYAFLEQGRDISPSSQVLDALARALRLSPAERDHLYALAQRAAPRGGDAPETLGAGIAALVERLDPYPSFVKGRRWDILAANRAARALFTDWLALPPGQRNELLWMFTDPRARDIYVDWEKEAAAMLARFRLAAARRPDDPDFAAVIEHLHRRSAEARGWWSRHEVLFPASGTKRLRHQLLGEITFDHVVLQVVDDPDQKLVTFSTADGNREPLTRLAATIAAPGHPASPGLAWQ
jgi:transcriptional regulator with XRE-family HTH domain